jgi:ADP-ribose pyrophosphatase
MNTENIETLYEGRYLRLKKRGNWEYAERTNAGSAVIIVALTPENNLLFVEQFRVPLNVKTIEMPAGLVGDIDALDTIEAAAKRELIEETGWEAKRVDVLLVGPSSAGMSTELVAFARASELTKIGPGGGDESENITVHEVPVNDAPRWLSQKMREGYSLDPKLWAGLWLLDKNPDGSAA